MTAKNSLWKELRRRNVFRVLVVYAVACWVLLQIADLFFPSLALSDEDTRYLLAFVVAGLPFVAVFAWTFELTPEGLRLTRQVEQVESIAHDTGRKINFIIVSLLFAGLVFFMNERFTRDQPKTVVTPKPPIVELTTLPVPTPGDTDDRPSIAVLPLVNMSSDIENEHFSDGLTDELLNVLAQNQNLRVSGRTSSFYYKDKKATLSEIGAELNVKHVLEGSVRKSGDTVRVTVQLVNTTDGFHLWSKTFDRNLSDIFAIQDEISNEVAEAMQVTLVTDGGLPGRTTKVVEAHDLYLRGKEALYQRDLQSVELAIELFQQSIKLDNSYAQPLLGLAEAVLVSQNNHRNFSLMEAADKAVKALDRAREIGLQNADYWAILGLHYHHLARIDVDNVALAEAAYQKSLQLNENSVKPYLWYSTLLSEEAFERFEVDSRDHEEQASLLLAKAIGQDPLNRIAQVNYQLSLSRLGRNAEAITNLKALTDKDPGYPTYQLMLALIYTLTGEFSAAAEQLATANPMLDRTYSTTTELLRAVGDKNLLIQYLGNVSKDHVSSELAEMLKLAVGGSTSEIVRRAQVQLQQPDYESHSTNLAYALLQHEEPRHARRLIENIQAELHREIPRLAKRNEFVTPYISALFQEGNRARAKTLAEQQLKANAKLGRVGVGGKGINDAVLYLVLDRAEEAVSEIEAAYAEGWRLYYADATGFDPIFAPILDDSRVVAIRAQTDRHIKEHKPAVIKALSQSGLL